MRNQLLINSLLLLLLPLFHFDNMVLAAEIQNSKTNLKAKPKKLSPSIDQNIFDESASRLRVAILIENSVQVDHNSILQGVSEINQTTISNSGVTLETAIDISYGVDPYKALLRACSLLQTNSDLIISKTSCETANTLKYMAQTLRVNHVLLPHTSSCAREDDTIDFFQRPSREKKTLRESFNIPSQTSLEPVFQMISKIVNRFTWHKVVLFHDSTYTQQVKLMSKYLENTVRDNDFNVFRYNVYEKKQSKNQVLNYLQELQAATDHEFRKKKSSNQKRAQLLDLIEDDENYRVTFTNFVVVANTQNSLEILAEGKKGGFVGQSCKWILANPDMDPGSLSKISNDTNVIAILRSVPQHPSFRDSTKGQGEQEETTEEVEIEEETEDKSDSQWLIPERLPNTFQTDLVVSFIQDAITLAATATASKKNSYRTELNVPVTCFDEQTTTAKNNTSSDVSRSHPLLQNMEYNQFHNSVTGVVTFDSHLGIVSSSDLIAARYSLIPAAKQQSGGGRTTQPFLINTDTENGGSEVEEEDEEVVKWEVIAEYSVRNRSWVEKNRSLFRDEFNSLKGLTLRIVTIEEEPFIIKKKTSTGLIYTGYCIDILTAIQRHVTEHGAPFDYRLYEVADKSYGVFDTANNKWTGLVGDIVSGKADMAVAGMIRNYERESVVDFAASFMDYGVGILIRKPQKTTSEFGFLEPFTVQVWICISVATFAIGTTLFVVSRLSPYSEWNRDGGFDFNFHNSMWFALASLMQQGCDVTPRTISGRIIGSFWWFFTLIIIATYTANLAAFLTVTRMDSPVESLQDLANQQKISYGTVSSSSLEQFFMKQADVDPSYKKIWNYMDSSRPLSMVQGVDEGYKRVLRGDYAFMWDYPVLMYQKKKHCELATVGKPFNRKNYAFALPKNAAYLESITLSILALQETGELEKLRQKWFEAESLCSDEDGSSGDESTSTAQGLEMQNVAGVFYILVMGAALSILTSLLEVIWYRFLQIPKFESNHSVLPPVKV